MSIENSIEKLADAIEKLANAQLAMNASINQRISILETGPKPGPKHAPAPETKSPAEPTPTPENTAGPENTVDDAPVEETGPKPGPKPGPEPAREPALETSQEDGTEKEITKADCLKILQEVYASSDHGEKICIELLDRFKCLKLSDMDPADYRSFYEHAQAILGDN